MKKLLLVLTVSLAGAAACERNETEVIERAERVETIQPIPTTPTGEPAPVPGRGEGERESLDPSGMPSTMPPPMEAVDPVVPAEPSDDQAEGDGHDDSWDDEHTGHDTTP